METNWSKLNIKLPVCQLLNKLQMAQAVWMNHWSNCSTGAELPAVELHGAALISGQTYVFHKKTHPFLGCRDVVVNYTVQATWPLTCILHKVPRHRRWEFYGRQENNLCGPTLYYPVLCQLQERHHLSSHSLIRWDCHIWHHVPETPHLWALREYQVRLNSAARRPGFEQPPSSTSWGRLVDICVFEAKLLISLNIFLKRLG